MTTETPTTDRPAPQIERHMHELKRRDLTVAKVEDLTPHMKRITLTGDELADFPSLEFDDHCKITVPGKRRLLSSPERRDYTPRRFDREARELVIDFAIHDAGPATQWAIDTKVGDPLTIGGPRGSRVITGEIDQWILVGDETALPAIGRKIEEAAPGTKITAIVAVPEPADKQEFDTEAELTLVWAVRPEAAADDPAEFIVELGGIDIPPGTFVWIAAEAQVAREIRRYVTEDRGVPLQWVKSSGYWVKGTADAKDDH